MATESKPRTRRPRRPRAPNADESTVSASEARKIIDGEADNAVEGEYAEAPAVAPDAPAEQQLPAVVHSTVDPGTTALALLSDDEFTQRLEMLRKGRERIAILQRELLIPSSDDSKADGDYGRIPGTDKPTLFKSGAEKLCQFYGFVARIEVTFRAGDNITTPPLIYDANCYLHLGSTDGPIVATGYGTANSWEKRYLRGGNLKCPNCDKPNIRKSKSDPEWYCWRKTGGCGSTFRLDDQRITSQTVDPKGDITGAYDLGVTLAKMAEKRAHVDATLRATATSGLFTQDVVEDENNDQPLDQNTTVTQGGAVVDADGVVTQRVETVDMTGNPDEDHAAAGEVPVSAPDQLAAPTDGELVNKARLEELAAAGTYVPQGEEVEQVLRQSDPMAEDKEPEFKPSAVEGVGRGGVTEGSNGPQIAMVKQLSKSLQLGPYGLIEQMMASGVLDVKIGEAMKQLEDKAACARALESRLGRMNGNQIGKLIHDLREQSGG
jgi:hypothetical protein